MTNKNSLKWFNQSKKPIYIVLLILCIIAFICSIYLAFTQSYPGVRKFLIFIMPILFGFYIYVYIKKIKSL